MTATIHPLRPKRQPSEAEAYVLRLADRADILERARLMEELNRAIMTLKEMQALLKWDGRK